MAKKMKSVRWSMTFGTNAGYELEEQKQADINAVAEALKDESAKVFAETGVYISSVLSESRVLYHADWGCPVGGEYAFTASGSCNTQFTELDQYMAALQKWVEGVKARFEQSTVLLEVTSADLYYFD